MTDSAPQFVEIFTANADQPEVARKLLEAAGDAPEQVATVFGGFRVPVAIAEAAGFGATDESAADAAAVEGDALASTTGAPAGDAPEGEATEAQTGEATATDPADAVGDVTEDQPKGDASEDEPKGAALDAALRDANLSTEGKADEKRARLAAHRAGTAS